MTDVIDVPAVVIRFALYANLMLLFGVPAFALYSVSLTDPVGPTVRIIRRSVLILTITALLLSVIGMAILCDGRGAGVGG